MNKIRVLVVTTAPESPLARRLGDALRDTGACDPQSGFDTVIPPRHPPELGPLVDRLRTGSPHVIVVCLPGGDADEVEPILDAAAEHGAGTPVLIATSALHPRDLGKLVECGAAGVVLEPFSVQDLTARLLCLGRLRRDAPAPPPTDPPEVPGIENMLGTHPAWVKEVRKIPQIAHCHANVLILGETGTGKELCARAIHQLGRRRDKPFAPLNCGAIPNELVENELFGHVRGAFTGAAATTTGIVQSADGGTLFLDEVDTLPCATQVKLLRFLQTREFRPVGSPHFQHVDVRVVAASNANLPEAIRSGRFRADLYYRLNVLNLHLPPLRSRTEDIPLLADHFLRRFAAEHDKPIVGLSPSALPRLLLHDWPGNVRELENVIERAVIVARRNRLEAGDISLIETEPETEEPGSFKAQKARAVAQFERAYLSQLLIAHDGNVSRAARAAQKNRRAFWELLRKHHLRVTPARSGPPLSPLPDR